MKTLKISNNGETRGVGMLINVNNGRVLEVEQAQDNGIIEVRTVHCDTTENTFTISPADMVSLLNWFRYQKDNGNINLKF